MDSKKRSKEKAEYKITEELGGLEILNAEYEKQNFSRHSHEGYTIGGAKQKLANEGEEESNVQSSQLVKQMIAELEEVLEVLNS